jgi:hypothetical protein
VFDPFARSAAQSNHSCDLFQEFCPPPFRPNLLAPDQIGPLPPVPDVKANNSNGTYYATTSTYLNMTVRLTDGPYADTQADWWVVGYFSGVYACLDQSGTWTTTPSTWSQADLADIYSAIFSGTLAAGTYTIFFGVDLTRDAIIDDPMYYDYITIVVQ